MNWLWPGLALHLPVGVLFAATPDETPALRRSQTLPPEGICFALFRPMLQHPAAVELAENFLLRLQRLGTRPIAVERLESRIIEFLELPLLPNTLRAHALEDAMVAQLRLLCGRDLARRHHWSALGELHALRQLLAHHRHPLGFRLGEASGALNAARLGRFFEEVFLGEHLAPYRLLLEDELTARDDEDTLRTVSIYAHLGEYQAPGWHDLNVEPNRRLDGPTDPKAKGMLRFGPDVGFEIADRVLKAWALNPDARMHPRAIRLLLKGARGLRQHCAPDRLAAPRAMLEALIGYLNPDRFPAKRRDANLAKEIAEELAHWGYRDEPSTDLPPIPET